MKPEVRIIEPQQEEIKPANISQSEREMLLAKYGHRNTPVQQTYVEPQQPISHPGDELTFEEMCRREDQRLADERTIKQQMRAPKPITFGGNNYHSNETYGSDSDSGLSFKVTIVSDMPIE